MASENKEQFVKTLAELMGSPQAAEPRVDAQAGNVPFRPFFGMKSFMERFADDEVDPTEIALMLSTGNNLVPALRVNTSRGTRVYQGKPGDLHGDVLNTIPSKEFRDLVKTEAGFIDTATGKYLNREEAFSSLAASEKGIANAFGPELHAGSLRPRKKLKDD